ACPSHETCLARVLPRALADRSTSITRRDMAKHRQRVALESQLLSVTQWSLQTEVEAKLRAIKRLRRQIERLSEPSRVSRVDDARRLQEQIKSMLEVNQAVRVTLTELEQVARELIEDLEAEDSA